MCGLLLSNSELILALVVTAVVDYSLHRWCNSLHTLARHGRIEAIEEE